MNIEDYNNLPETISMDELEGIYEKFIIDSRSEKIQLSLTKLSLLSDKQWHTYELPCEVVQQAVSNWLYDNWISDSGDFLATALLASYSFGLKKSIFIKALEQFAGGTKSEYQNDLDNSVGDSINPYWSLE